jgi:hypothetical protein
MAAFTELGFGMTRRVTDAAGQVLPELRNDRWVAVPMRARATGPKGYVNDFTIEELVTKPGYEPRVNKDHRYSQVPSRHRHSEGWAWTHGHSNRDEAEKRLLANCADGVVFLMFDGNWWNGGCLNPAHGHPVSGGIEFGRLGTRPKAVIRRRRRSRGSQGWALQVGARTATMVGACGLFSFRARMKPPRRSGANHTTFDGGSQLEADLGRC